MSCDSANAGCALRETILILVLLYRSEACLANFCVKGQRCFAALRIIGLKGGRYELLGIQEVFGIRLSILSGLSEARTRLLEGYRNEMRERHHPKSDIPGKSRLLQNLRILSNLCSQILRSFS
jgi:hypothetical protein